MYGKQWPIGAEDCQIAPRNALVDPDDESISPTRNGVDWDTLRTGLRAPGTRSGPTRGTHA
jgi:hypothetical protein